MRHMNRVATGKGYPGCQRRKLLERVQQRASLFERRNRLQRQQIGADFSQHGQSLCVKRHQILEADRVTAMIFGPVVQRGAVRSQRRGDPHAPRILAGIIRARLLGDAN